MQLELPVLEQRKGLKVYEVYGLTGERAMEIAETASNFTVEAIKNNNGKVDLSDIVVKTGNTLDLTHAEWLYAMLSIHQSIETLEAKLSPLSKLMESIGRM